MKPILLIYPKTGNYDHVTSNIPYSLLFLATHLLDEYDVKILDQRVSKNWQEELTKELQKNPVAVGISTMTGSQITHSLEIARFIRSKSKVPLIWGGIHPTLLPEQTLEHPLVDIVVRGNSPLTFKKVLASMPKLSHIPNICFKNSKGTVCTPTEIEPIDYTIPFDLVNVEDYHPYQIKGRKAISLITSMGCNQKCAHCIHSTFPELPNSFQCEEDVIKNIIKFYKKGFNFVYFLDDNILTNFPRFERILDGIIDEKLDIKWAAQGVSPKLMLNAKPAFLKKLVRGGCYSLDFGIESFNDSKLKLLGKMANAADNRKIVKMMKPLPFMKKYNIMIGLPGETENQIRKDVDAAIKVMNYDKNSYVLMNPYMPYPGTKLCDKAVELGFNPPKTLEGWGSYNMQGNIQTWIPEKTRKLLRKFWFLFPFYNKSAKMRFSGFSRVLFDLYHPIAKWRLNNRFYNLFIEDQLMKLF